jgi:hypothetical protein
MIKNYTTFLNEQSFHGYDPMIYDYEETKIDKIAKSVSKELGYNSIDRIGGGDYGIAYRTNDNKVLKITRDKNEYKVANYLKNKNTTYLINYYDVRKIEGTDLFSLLMDYVEPLDPLEKTFVYIFNTHFVRRETSSKSGRIYNIPKEKIKDFVDKFSQQIELTQKEMYFLIEELIKVQREGEKYNISCIDLKNDNIGWIYDRLGKHLVFFDIGVETDYKTTNKELKSLKV